MNRVNILQNATLDTPVILTEFIDIYKKHKKENKVSNYLYCFYEGKDDNKYYNIRVKQLGNKNVSHLNCNGKDKLLDLHKEIERRKQNISVYREGKLIFFIDKDFDDLIKQEKLIELQNIENLYITPSYSIENFYTTLEAFQEILKSEFHLKEIDNEFDKLSELFSDRQNEFHNIMLDVNGWIITQNYFLLKEKRDIPYNDLSIDKIINISLQEIKSKEIDIIKFLENKFTESFKMENSEVTEKFQELKIKLSQNSQANFRGKFEIEFLSKFLKQLIEKSNQKDGLGLTFIDINEKIKVQLTLNDTISNLSQYADTPSCLKNFIKRERESF